MHAHIHTQGQFRIISLPNMDVFEENPCRHGANMQNPHRKAWIQSQAFLAVGADHHTTVLARDITRPMV